jgi:MFS transporter, DHA1 family, tetracycline resistance protein
MTMPITPALRFLLFTIFINAMGFGIIVPVTPDLVMEISGQDVSGASAIGGWLAVSYAAMQFICGPIVGNLSDRFGRRPVILLSLLGFALEFLLMAIAPSLFWLFLARILSGLFGATQGPAQSAIADTVTADDRARVYSLLSAAFAIGFVAGPALGGLLGGFGPRVPFYVAAALAIANLLYGLKACKETLPPERRRPFEWKRANPIGALQQARKLPGILPLALVYFLWQVASITYPLIWNYFTKSKFGWSPELIGLSLAAIGVSMGVVNILIAPRIVSRFREKRSAQIGIGIGIIGFLANAFAPSAWMLFPLCALVAFQALTHPALTALMTRYGTGSTQGEVQGFASSIMALGAIVAPLIFNPLHSYFTSASAPFRFDGAPLVVAAVIAALAFLLLSRLKFDLAPASLPA